MLRILCPYCGERDQDEFHYGGEATVERPARPKSSADAEWSRYLFYRDNRRGMHLERWVHDASELGQHTAAVLQELGFSDDEIQSMRGKKAI